MTKTYYIFRHGETFATLQKRWYWNKLYSAVIAEEGKPIIAKLANYLKDKPSDYNVCSPFIRCRQTAEIVTKETGKQFELDGRLGEYTFELPWDFKRRIVLFAQEMEQSKHTSIVICTHAIVIQMLTQYLTRGHISFSQRMSAPLPGVLTIIKDKKTTEINFNTAVIKKF